MTAKEDQLSHRRLLYVSAPIVLGAAIYLPFVRGGLLTDDFVHFTRLLTRPSAWTLLTRADTFHFYRPLPQLSLWSDLNLFGLNPFAFRLTNLTLHFGVLVSALWLARLILEHWRAAFLATLAFAFTPKAHPIAVLWISARSELLMSLFAVLAVACWVKWGRSNCLRWFAAAWLFYLMAALSKETAILLPFLLFFTPSEVRKGGLRGGHRWSALLIATSIAVIFMVRVRVGAIMPTTLDPHYGLIRPLGIMMRNLTNYIPRALSSVIAMLIICVTIPLFSGRYRRQSISWNKYSFGTLVVFATTWFVVFIAPVLPISGRSELYLYLPALGVCLLAGAVVDCLWQGARSRVGIWSAVAIYVLMLGAYQMTRAYEMHQRLVFSAQLLDRLRSELRDYEGLVVVFPADPRTSLFLSDSVGGYSDLVLKFATGRYEVNGIVRYSDEPFSADALRLQCAYQNGELTLSRIQ